MSSCVRVHLIDFGNGNFSGKYESADEVGAGEEESDGIGLRVWPQ